MDKITLVPSLIVLGAAGLIACFLSFGLCWWWRMRCLKQQLLTQQKSIDLLAAEIHNGPLQQLAFLIRELQVHELSQQELLQHLREVYQDVQTAFYTDNLLGVTTIYEDAKDKIEA